MLFKARRSGIIIPHRVCITYYSVVICTTVQYGDMGVIPPEMIRLVLWEKNIIAFWLACALSIRLNDDKFRRCC